MQAVMLGVRDLVARAAEDPAFAQVLMEHPEVFREEYGLTDEQCDQIKLLAGKGLLTPVSATRLQPNQGGSGYY